MSDMNKTVAPKTDQINFDHFVGGKSITIKITEVKFDAGARTRRPSSPLNPPRQTRVYAPRPHRGMG